MAKSVASGFTISGLLDRNASTRSDYPVERIPVGEIADHPANAAYSMDEPASRSSRRASRRRGSPTCRSSASSTTGAGRW